jgi:hypothetical protein
LTFTGEAVTMSLTTRQRSSIYQKLLPILGEEDADAMIAQYPASEHDQLVTREHLRAEMAILRAEMHQLINRNTAAMTGLLLAAMGLIAAFD